MSQSLWLGSPGAAAAPLSWPHGAFHRSILMAPSQIGSLLAGAKPRSYFRLFAGG